MTEQHKLISPASSSSFNKDQWWDILSDLIDVLRINIFVMDADGRLLLPPDERRYGGQLLTDPAYKLHLFQGTQNFLNRFEPFDQYLEYTDPLDYRIYAVPINYDKGSAPAYVLVGPVILNRLHKTEDYTYLAEQIGSNVNELLGLMREVRTVSNLMLKSILDLLAKIIRRNTELQTREREMEAQMDQQHVSKILQKEARDIYSAVCVDELLVSLLDIALKLTDMENGSIMVFDEVQKHLMVRVAKGLSAKKIEEIKVKRGEGIAGLAVEGKETFIINDKEKPNRIAHFLQRPAIKESIVMPLMHNEHAYGVLNLHTYKETSRVGEQMENLRYLAKLISAAL